MLHYGVKSCWDSGVITWKLGIHRGQGEMQSLSWFGKGWEEGCDPATNQRGLFLLGSERFHLHPWNVSWAPGNDPRAWAVMDKTPQKLRAGGAALTCSNPWGRNPHDLIPNPHDHIPNPVSRSQTSVRPVFPRAGHCRDFISERIPCLGLAVQGNAKGIPWRPRYPLTQGSQRNQDWAGLGRSPSPQGWNALAWSQGRRFGAPHPPLLHPAGP